MRYDFDRFNAMKEMLTTPAQWSKWLEPYFDLDVRRNGVSPTTGSEMTVPACDLSEDAERYSLRFDLPGVKKENIKIEMVGNHLLVSGERKQKKEEKRDGSRFVERSHGSFRREITFPAAVRPEKVEAIYEDGVLELMIPKLEAKMPRTIPIKESSHVSLSDSRGEGRSKVA